MTSKCIIICGNYGATNVGDEAILDGLLQIIRKQFGNPRIIVLSSNPQETSTLHKVESAWLLPSGIRSFLRNLFNGQLRQTLTLIKNCDLFVLGGGGLFTDEKWQAVLIWGIQAYGALRYNKSLWCIGQSVGPLKSRLSRLVVRKVFTSAQKIVVRDLDSKILLENMGVKTCFITVFPDPVLTLNVGMQLTSPEHYIVMSLRPWISGESTLLYKNIARFITWIYTEYGFRTVLIPFQIGKDTDINIMNKIIDHISDKSLLQANFPIVEIFEFTLDYKKILALISRAQLMVGMRLHSLIFSVLTLTPFVALSYSSKVSSFVDSLGIDADIIPYESVTFHTLRKTFLNTFEDRAHFKEKLIEYNIKVQSNRHRL